MFDDLVYIATFEKKIKLGLEKRAKLASLRGSPILGDVR